MIYKKQFGQLPYAVRRRTGYRFLFLLFFEFFINKLIIKYNISLTITPLFWLIFTKKYFKFFTGITLFTVGYIFYFCFCDFSFFYILLVAITLFCCTYAIGFAKLSVIFAYASQQILCMLYDSSYNETLLWQSLVPMFLLIAICKFDPVPVPTRRRKSVFL